MAFATILKSTAAYDILVYLFRRGKSPVTQVIADTGISTEAFYGAINRLRDLGFLYRDEQIGYPSYVYLGLTRAGERVARVLVPVADVLAQTEESFEAELARLERENEPATIARRLELLELLEDRDFTRGRWDKAQQAAERLRELARTAHDLRREAEAQLAVGRIAQKRDERQAALDALGEALRIAGEAGLEDVACESEYLIGSSLERQGRWEQALERYASGTERANRSRTPLWSPRLRMAGARILSQRGRHAEALPILQEVVAEFERLGAEDDLPRAYANLGSTTYSLGRPDAPSWFEKAVDAARISGDLRIEAYAMANASAGLIDLQEFRRAEGYLKRAREAFCDLGERMGLGGVALNLGNLRAAQDRWSEAEAAFEEALRIAHNTGNRGQEASVQFGWGLMGKRRVRPEEARAHLSEARRLFSDLGNAARVARCDEELRGLTETGTR